MAEKKGLTSAEVAARLAQDGHNTLSAKQKSRLGAIILEQFKDYMVLMLIGAAIVSALMRQFTEAFSVLAIVLINALLGVVQEYRTEKALDRLKAMSAPTARVFRDGAERLIPSAELVAGDRLLLEEGDRIGADGALVVCNGLACDESMLTGESIPVRKSLSAKAVYMGTLVTAGRGEAVVTATGMRTEMGKIASLLGSAAVEQTPLQKRLKSLGKVILVCCLLICACVTVTGILRGEDVLEMLLSGISLAVAAIPEGLPAVVTVSLAMGISRMSKQSAVIRRFPAVETLGCVDVICSDKTGTLTENRMTATRFWVDGDLRDTGGAPSPALLQMMESGVLCSNARLVRRGRRTELVGDPTEGAILSAAASFNVTAASLAGQCTRVREFPFSSERRRMSVAVQTSGGLTGHLKGAPDELLRRCDRIMLNGRIEPLTPALRTQAEAASRTLAEEALRVLAVAFRPSLPAADISHTESGCVLLGLIGMMDPPRREAFGAVEECKRAGIRPVMITGDHRATARAIAERLGIAKSGDRILTGAELDALSESELAAVSGDVSVYARVSPRHKLMIVRALKRRGLVTAMTGDGVNDAPAVKEADIGICMGKTGADVTKESSDVMLLDDNFASIVSIVRQGRMIYDNIRKFIRYMLSSNLGEVLTMFAAILFALPLPLLPVHILLVNLATDGLPAMALSMDPASDDVMSRPPRGRGESIFAHGLGLHILLRGFFIGACTVGMFWVTLRQCGDVMPARTAAFLTLAASQLIFVFECKSEQKGMFSRRIFNNPYLILAVVSSFALMGCAVYIPALAAFFSLTPLSLRMLGRCLGVSVLGAVLSSLATCLTRRRHSSGRRTAH